MDKILGKAKTLNSQFSIMTLLLTLYSLLPIQRVESLASSSWFGGLILIVLIALALSVSAHRKQYTLYVRNLLYKQERVMNYDTESTSIWVNLLLWFVVVSSFALTVISLIDSYLFLATKNVSMGGIVVFLILFGGFMCYFLLKWLIIRFIGYVFDLRDLSNAFSTDYFVLVALSGIMLLPFVLGLIYSDGTTDLVLMFCMLTLAILFVITLFIKLLQIFYTGFSSLFYIFLYLCTSEILPLFVAVKIAQMW